MSHQPVFSIITVTYNAERWLERTILSVLSQSYTNVEYLIIDGGSKDRTVEIIRQYASGLAYWVSEPDKGLYDAMNKGLRQATGDYLVFLNAGDTFHTQCGGYVSYVGYLESNSEWFAKAEKPA